jgi:spore germination cell wall hydrolase CwlJ-like protein
MVMNKAYKVSVIALVAAVTYALVADRSTAGMDQIVPTLVYKETDAALLDQAHCLATNIYFEARHQDDYEKEAIANVVINRARDKSFPDTICGVVYQAVRDSNGNPLRDKCQFSWYCDGKSDKIKDAAAYDDDFNLALTIILNREEEGPDNVYTYDNTNNSLWYHAHYVKPYWATSYTFQERIGAHLFYSR